MTSGTKSKSKRGAAKGKGKSTRAARSAVVAKPKPWGTILAVIGVLALAVGVFGYAYIQISENQKWQISEENKDPSVNIEGVVKKDFVAGKHVTPEQRVAYPSFPPFGGPHDAVWADCSGTIYHDPVRNENMVHSLEHGAVWIAYNPDQVNGNDLNVLREKVNGQPYMMISPYPGLDHPISLQSWGHQLKLDDPHDERIDQFIKSLRQNQYQNPEPRGSCDSLSTGFDPTNPPPFVAEKPGKDAVPMDGTGASGPAMGEVTEGQTPASEPAGEPSASEQPKNSPKPSQ